MRVLSTPALLACFFLASCSGHREYEVRGQVLAVDAAKGSLTLKHDDIRGFMPAMTMTFRVADERLLQEREAGELIAATLVVKENTGYLSAIRRTGTGPLPATPADPAMDLLDPGEQVPDAAFLDQSGRQRKLSDWRGQAVAVTFVYTRCPLPSFCPLMDRNFREAQHAIAQDPALRGRAHLLSVSFDPAYDTPAVLAAHAARVSADSTQWTILTGRPEEIDEFASHFGVSILRDASGADIVHNLRTAVIDARGRLAAILPGSEWTPAQLIEHLRKAA